MLRLPADYHVHTSHSGDSDASMEKVILQGIALDLPAICITDHMDIDYVYEPHLEPGLFYLDTDACYAEYVELSRKYQDRIPVHFGVELGLQPEIVAKNKEYVEKYPFDFVIGSNHLVHGYDPYYPEYFEGRPLHEAVYEFFVSTLENVRTFDDYDVFGHLDYINRYLPGGVENYHPEEFSELIDEILKSLIARDKGLDVNTKILASGISQPNPCSMILRRYYELGGRILTFGSDAHVPEDLARGFDQAAAVVKECGFKEYCIFEKRTPKFLPL